MRNCFKKHLEPETLLTSVSIAWFGALAFCSVWNLSFSSSTTSSLKPFHMSLSPTFKDISLSLSLPCNPKSVRFAPVRSTHLHLYLQFSHLLTTASPPLGHKLLESKNHFIYPTTHTPGSQSEPDA